MGYPLLANQPPSSYFSQNGSQDLSQQTFWQPNFSQSHHTPQDLAQFVQMGNDDDDVVAGDDNYSPVNPTSTRSSFDSFNVQQDSRQHTDTKPNNYSIAHFRVVRDLMVSTCLSKLHQA
ncbi:hypothetical protein A9306_07465 [Moraxella atlantae]|uniref:Uncharacterized protein n=1 Tax=Faucicola atlantae TaxID=34059 RepID=A0A1B8QEY3_9GAMM|nr:hypothetical protein A9306_07465 [Moraxella atlantae]